MGKDWSNDSRVVDMNGKISRSRMYVLEALEAQGRDGATSDEILALIGDEIGGARPSGAIGQSLYWLESTDVVEQHRGRWYLKECAPNASESSYNGSNSNAAFKPAMNGHKAQIAPFVGKRTSKRISLYTGHRCFEDVIVVQLLIQGRWIPIVLGDAMRIMIAFEAPNWSPDQVVYSDVEVVKFIHKDGGVYEERPAPKDLVTVDFDL